MSGYDYIDEDGSKGTGIDWNLAECLDYNPQGFTIEQVARVAAVIEGEHEGPDWHWVLELKGGQWAYLVGGCDYTGWDCQSGAWSKVVPDAITACTTARDLTDDEYGYSSPEERKKIGQALWTQIIEGKSKTARGVVAEQMKGQD